MKTSNLGTKLTFTKHDVQGKWHFPQGEGGFAYEYKEFRTIFDRYTGRSIKRDVDYVVRTDVTGKGWRIDILPQVGPAETVYGPDRQTYWATPQAAARVLVGVLDEIETCSSLAA